MTPSALPADAAQSRPLSRRRDVQAAQVRLLYKNGNVGVVVTVIASAVLGRLQWAVVPHNIILAWCVYMCAVSVARHILWRRYMRKTPPDPEMHRWGGAFAFGASLAGIGWGAAGVLMYA